MGTQSHVYPETQLLRHTYDHALACGCTLVYIGHGGTWVPGYADKLLITTYLTKKEIKNKMKP